MKLLQPLAFAVCVLSVQAQQPADPQAPKPQEPRGLVRTSERAAPGYTLVAPLSSGETSLRLWIESTTRSRSAR